MLNFAFLRPHVGPTLVNTHSISPNEGWIEVRQHSISKHYDEGYLSLGSTIL
jgi:hypothetical protein